MDDIEDPDILKVYGQEETSTVQALASYTFEVRLICTIFRYTLAYISSFSPFFSPNSFTLVSAVRISLLDAVSFILI